MSGRVAAWVGLTVSACAAHGQVIDFETLPDSTPTSDQQTISDQYGSYGVLFSVVDDLGNPSGYPLIAKAGSPVTAFNSCWADDTPAPGQGLGVSFLTDDTSLGVPVDLVLTYLEPVAAASGVILDIDCRGAGGGPPCEQWTILALNAADSVLATVVVDALAGPPNPECPDAAGAGDAMGVGWFFIRPSADISAIRFHYTGTPSDVGLAFDNISTSNVAGPPSVTVAATADTVCIGESVTLSAQITAGLPPFSYQWQEEIAPGVWSGLGTARTQVVAPSADANYRVRVSDQLLREDTSDPVAVRIVSGESECGTRFLVSSFNTNSIESYGGKVGGFHSQLVPPGSGSLVGPSGLVCGSDGNLYVSSQSNHSILRYDKTTGAFVDVLVPSGGGGLSYPVDLLFARDGSLLVASYGTDQVLRYDGESGAFLGAFVAAGSGGLSGPTGMTWGPDAHLYVASRDNDRILRYDGASGATLGTFVASGAGGLDAPRGLTFGPDGHLYVAEELNDRVSRFDGATGAFLDVFVPAGSGGLDRANDVLFEPGGDLLVVSTDTDQVLSFDRASGSFLRVIGREGLDRPSFLSFPYAEEFTPAFLAHSSVRATDDGVEVIWRTSAEWNVAGFNVLRAEAGGDGFRTVNEALIPAAGRDHEYRVLDRSVWPGRTYVYRLEVVDLSGERQVFALQAITVPAGAAAPTLPVARPNPFGARTTIAFEIAAEGSEAELRIYDAGGRLIRNLLKADLDRGPHHAVWNGRDERGRPVGAGTYFFVLETPGRRLSGRLIRAE
jgi:hypothetical protein